MTFFLVQLYGIFLPDSAKTTFNTIDDFIFATWNELYFKFKV